MVFLCISLVYGKKITQDCELSYSVRENEIKENLMSDNTVLQFILDEKQLLSTEHGIQAGVTKVINSAQQSHAIHTQYY